MGLDQYLFRIDGEMDDAEAESTEVGYWRKANQIHRWFIKATGAAEDSNCERLPVSLEQLAGLQVGCQRVLDARAVDPLSGELLAAELFPPMAGFFFGSTEYDEWYYRDLEDTVKIITEVMAEEKVRHETKQSPGKYAYFTWW